MKRITRLFVLVGLVMAGRMAFANGDPVAIKSALTLSRTPVAVHVPEVQVVNEQCRFSLGSGYVDVEVRYTLQNRSKKDFKSLPYGFPIDWYGKGPARWVGTDIYSESVMERGWRDDYVRNVSFMLGGRALAYKMSGDTILNRAAAVCDPGYISEVMYTTNPTLPESDPLLSADSAGDYFSAARVRQITAKYGDSLFYYNYDLCRRWYYCLLDIPAGQTVELTVRYRIENECDYPLYSAAWVFNNGMIDNTFAYDFSPAAYWGNGRADRFRVEIDSTGIVVPDWAEVVVDCFNAKHTKKGWMYETSNFDFASSEPLRINYFAKGYDDATTLLKRRINPSRYTVKLSGVDPKYPVENMSDNDFATTTVLRADSKGNTTIRIVFKDSTYVSGLMIYNGYTKNAEVWRNNSRIDSISYSINGMAGSFDDMGFVILYDNHIGDQIRKGAPKSYTRQGLTDAAIKIPIANTVNIWGDQPLPKVKELTITIHKAKKGAKYDDLCVSEIILLQ